jgi:hypothetical protein
MRSGLVLLKHLLKLSTTTSTIGHAQTNVAILMDKDTTDPNKRK